MCRRCLVNVASAGVARGFGHGECMTDNLPLTGTRTFGLDQITAARQAIATQAAGYGLAGEQLADFVLAVNELMNNAIRHAGGRGRVRLWPVDGVLCCEVSDEGPGIPHGILHHSELPPAFSIGGRGLWLVRHLCDSVDVATGPAGTTIRVTTALPTAGTAPAQAS
jgi:anti-sigma regulatory factor (Ser/Thr protein kinase)